VSSITGERSAIPIAPLLMVSHVEFFHHGLVFLRGLNQTEISRFRILDVSGLSPDFSLRSCAFSFSSSSGNGEGRSGVAFGDSRQKWTGGRSPDLTPGYTQAHQLERALESGYRTFLKIALFLQA
jgi:hypothetical protein